MKSRDLKDYERNYSDKDHYGFEAHQIEFRRRNCLKHIAENRHGHILEVGCGMEPLFCYLSDFISYTLIEPAEAFYENAVQLSEADTRVSIFNDYIENLRVKKKFDFVILSSLLHELENPQEVLKAIRKFCHTGTVIYINVPNARSFHRLLAAEAGLIDSVYSKSENQKKFQQFHTYDISALRQLVDGAGYSVINSGSYFLKPFTHSQMRMLLTHEIISLEVLEGLEGMIEYCPDLGSEIFMTCQLLE